MTGRGGAGLTELPANFVRSRVLLSEIAESSPGNRIWKRLATVLAIGRWSRVHLCSQWCMMHGVLVGDGAAEVPGREPERAPLILTL